MDDPERPAGKTRGGQRGASQRRQQQARHYSHDEFLPAHHGEECYHIISGFRWNERGSFQLRCKVTAI